MKRFIVAGLLLAAALVGVAFAVVLVRGNNNGSPGERVARAVDDSETYLESEVSSHRARIIFSTTQNDVTDRRDPSGAGVDIEFRLDVTVELQDPDRRRITWDSSKVYGDEPNKVYPDGPCPSVSVAIGLQTYEQRCDGTWMEGPDLPEAVVIGVDRTNEFAALRDLSTVTQQDSEVLRGVEVDVYAGTYTDDGQERDVIVKIGREHGLVRYFRATSPGFSREIERWDFNDVVIEAPPLS